ncbi:hypothetical protein ACG7TL_003382 [Trametes sanguinea]
MGVLTSKSFNPTTDIPYLDGKVAIVTGGNAGVGFGVVQHLARHGAKVYMAARSEKKAHAAIVRLRDEGLGPGNGEVVWLDLDLADPRTTRQAAIDFMKKEERLDILVNNAALLLVPYQKSHDGIQDVVMVNYIGTYVFTRSLLPVLRRTAQEPGSDVRIVAVNAEGNKLCPHDVRFGSLEDLNRDFANSSLPQFMRYTFSKLMQLMFIEELQRRLDENDSPILCMATCPGAVNTEGVQAYAHSVGPILSPLYTLIANLTFATPTKGAYSTVFAAASPVPREHVDEYRGAFLKNPGMKTAMSPVANNVANLKELWETTERILREAGVERHKTCTHDLRHAAKVTMGSFFSKSFDPATDVPDLSGKVAIVTGGNAGIGFAIVQHLARHGAKVYMGARNEQRANAALERLRAEGLLVGPGNGEVVWLKLDLSDPRDTKRAAEEFMRKEERLDILINNAALLLVPYQKSHDGIQDVVMVNYIGTYVFTRALLPILKRTAREPGSDVRIVAVNSDANEQCPHDVRFRDLDDLNKEFADKSFPQFLRYAFSKLMQWMFMRELQQQLDEEGVPILCLGVDPGQVNTGSATFQGVRAYANSVGPILAPIYILIANLFFAPPTKGAYGAVFAAASPVPRAREKEYKGALLKNSGAKTSASPLADKAELRKELWDTTARTLKYLGVEIEKA